jgi:hypothetical protein
VVPLPMAALHLGALSALAIAQPLLDVTSSHPDFLAARRLIGRQVVALGLGLVLVSPLVGLGVEALAGLASVRLRSDFLPAHLTGTVHDAGGRRSRDLAVALNGRIVAVRESFRPAGSDAENFSILLPERAFREGRNRVQLLSVADEDGSLRLAAIARAG